MGFWKRESECRQWAGFITFSDWVYELFFCLKFYREQAIYLI